MLTRSRLKAVATVTYYYSNQLEMITSTKSPKWLSHHGTLLMRTPGPSPGHSPGMWSSGRGWPHHNNRYNTWTTDALQDAYYACTYMYAYLLAPLRAFIPDWAVIINFKSKLSPGQNLSLNLTYDGCTDYMLLLAIKCVNTMPLHCTTSKNCVLYTKIKIQGLKYSSEASFDGKL